MGLLDLAFESEGFCVVRGPDALWGGDVRKFFPPAGRFDGLIGGPPCQPFSELRKLLRATGRDTKAVNLVPEYTRIVEAARPTWFLMENVKAAPSPTPAGYQVSVHDVCDFDVGGHTRRSRRFWFGTVDGRPLEIETVPRPNLFPPERAVTRNARIPDERHRAKARAKNGHRGLLPGDGRYMPVPDVCELQGLPRTYFDDTPFLTEKVRLMLGNGVPLPLGRAVARAVLRALNLVAEGASSPT